MGHDEETNNFNGGTTPVTPNPRAQFTSGNRLGMRPARNFSAMDELNRITEAEQRENLEANGGDVVIATAEAQPKDKKLFIIAILAAAVVIVFAIGFFIKGGISNIIGGNNASGDYKKEFNQYANYLISGEMSEAALTGSNDGLRNYAFNKAVRGTSEEKSKFINEMYGLFEKFHTDFTAAKVNDSALNSRVSSYYSNLKMIYLYEKADKIDDAKIIQEYMEVSEQSARNMIANSYNDLASSDSEVAKMYAETLREANYAYLTQLVRANSAGCITKEKGYDLVCANQRTPYDEEARSYIEKRQAVIQSYNAALGEVVTECWNLSDMINAKGEGK